MKTKYRFAIILVLVSASALFVRGYFKDYYSVEKVDKLLREILVKQEKHIIQVLLDYSKNTHIDGGNSVHYYANLYIVYKLYRKEFLQLKNRKKYSETITHVIEYGERCFEDYYQEMSLDDVVKRMKE